jgi:hypothetical protein
MKNRFPIENRAGWRQRFLAIAREMEDAGAHRREFLGTSPAVRARFLMPRSLRGVRLGCARAG